MRYIHRLPPLLLLLLLFGCGPRSIELSSPIAEGIGHGASNTIVMTAGEALSLPVALPALKQAASLEITAAQPPLSARLQGDSLLLACETPGSYPLTLTLQAEGYTPLEIPCQVRVEPRPMALTVVGANGSPVEAITLARGESAAYTLLSEEGASFSASASPQDHPCGVSLEDGLLTLTGLQPGEGTVELRAALEGWSDAALSLPVSVTAIPAELSVAQTSLSGLVGQALTLPCTIDPEGTLEVACDSRLSATVGAGGVTFTASEPGNYQVVLTVNSPGDLPSSRTVSVVYTLPTVSLTVPNSLSLSAGGSTTARITATAGASVWVKASAGISASVGSDGILTVSADKKGSGTVTVGAELAGYQAATADIPVTVSVSLPSTSSRYASEAQEIAKLVNEERAARGLKALTYRSSLEGLAQLRAREASEYWSHTRPDGRECNTIFFDYDLHYRATGENLFASNLFDVDLAMDEWMASSSHRANILRADSDVDGIAVGIVRGSDGDYYICQLFVAD